MAHKGQVMNKFPTTVGNYLRPSVEPIQVKVRTQKKYNNLAGVYRLSDGREMEFDSQAEARLAQVMLDQNLPFERVTQQTHEPILITKKFRRYPDFQLKTTKGILYLEVKGQLTSVARQKIRETARVILNERKGMYALKLAGREDAMLPLNGISPLSTDLKSSGSRGKHKNCGKTQIDKMVTMAMKEGFPIIRKLEDAKNYWGFEWAYGEQKS